MATIQIKQVPEKVHSELASRASRAGKSLQSYLLDQLIIQTSRPSLDEWLSKGGFTPGPSIRTEEIVRSIRESREERDEHLMSLVFKDKIERD